MVEKKFQNILYAKSFEEDFSTKTLKNKSKVVCQTIVQILNSKKLRPNTISFGQKKRLSCTILHKNYAKTYRPQGLIFKTMQKPKYVLPFDLIALSTNKNIKVQYYRIKNNLHLHYNHKLIDGFKEFVFGDFNSMKRKINSPKKAWQKLNEFREKNGFGRLSKSKFKLVEYNEAVFEQLVKIEPIALFGRGKMPKELAKKFKLPHFNSAKEAFKSINNVDNKSLI